ncbi:Hypothetical predicted protein [Scomber scombrus]
MIRNLDDLEKLYQGKKLNVTAGFSVSVPSPLMSKNASVCLDVFTRQLKLLLDNVTVHNDSESLLEKLKVQLKGLESHPKPADPRCQMKNPMGKPFKAYSNFLKKLNNGRR